MNNLRAPPCARAFSCCDLRRLVRTSKDKLIPKINGKESNAMKVTRPKPPYLMLKRLVVRMGGKMCSIQNCKYWVIIVGGRIGVFPTVSDGRLGAVPQLDELHDHDRLRPDAKERLLEILDDPQWTI
ncbi:MAG: hypothetical protein OXF54_04490 [Caldilineaceae bacterium]|nr:hypothetical protein [Caldilineaceae bacterium]